MHHPLLKLSRPTSRWPRGKSGRNAKCPVQQMIPPHFCSLVSSVAIGRWLIRRTTRCAGRRDLLARSVTHTQATTREQRRDWRQRSASTPARERDREYLTVRQATDVWVANFSAHRDATALAPVQERPRAPRVSVILMSVYRQPTRCSAQGAPYDAERNGSQQCLAAFAVFQCSPAGSDHLRGRASAKRWAVSPKPES